MKHATFNPVLSAPVFFLGSNLLALAGEPERKLPADVPVELSPFLVEENTDQGYYSSQTLAGGRLRQDIKDLGTSIQVVTKELMDDLGVTGVEELFQYTTSTEVAGILGNFTGASDNSDGEVNTGDARRNPDATTRVRGLSAPDRTRNFFKSDIPFDSYNTDRVDINRGANSFLFGLGSPSGLVNAGMVKARFRDTNEVSTRMGSGGKNPSYRGSLNLNRVLIKDTLAIHGAALTDRTQYRQEPTYKDDDRLYGALAYRPFKNADTIISAYVERGKIDGNAPDVMLPHRIPQGEERGLWYHRAALGPQGRRPVQLVQGGPHRGGCEHQRHVQSDHAQHVHALWQPQRGHPPVRHER